MNTILLISSMYLSATLAMGISIRYLRYAFSIHILIIVLTSYLLYHIHDHQLFMLIILYGLLPLFFINVVLYSLIDFIKDQKKIEKKYTVKFKLKSGSLKLQNIRRGASVIGSAGSGKTESVVYNFLKHFQKHQFCGIIHDYKYFEITEMVYPLFQNEDIPFHIISFDEIHSKVNPIAPRYMQDEESVNEVSRVLLENLLEQRESIAMGSSKFFNDALPI